MTAFWAQGTITLTTNSATVTGQGTAFLSSLLRAGDTIESDDGRRAAIASVDGDTAITLDKPWRGAGQTAAPYKGWYTPNDVYLEGQARLAFSLGTKPNIMALAGLAGLADKIPYFTGPGTMALMDRGSAGGGLIPRGSWDSGTTYNQRDLVEHDGRAFASIADGNVGNTPPSTATSDAHWMYVPVAPTSLNDLSDVFLASPANGRVIRYQDGFWRDAVITADDVNAATPGKAIALAMIFGG